MRRFVIRTVCNGQVKIFGRVMRPDRACHELEGRRFAFGLYELAGQYEPFVSLWGTEEEYQFQGDPETFSGERPHVQNGEYLWMWWREPGKTAATPPEAETAR